MGSTTSTTEGRHTHSSLKVEKLEKVFDWYLGDLSIKLGSNRHFWVS